jgi:predicted alpha/beta-hydrolase family hydrolase
LYWLMPREVSVSVGERQTTARVFGAKKSKQGRLILAHGAGADQRHPSLVALAEGVAARGVEVVTFNFLYMEGAGRRPPDRAPLLEACWRAVLARFGPAFIGGRSMGGRIASHLAAAGDDGILGLVCVGYPLHPPDQPDKRRDAHLPPIRQPMLFVQGSRDPFGGEDELRPLAKKLGAELYVVGGGDHSLAVGKKRQAESDAAVQQKIVDFVTSGRTRPRRRAKGA